jgi:hypothetical protein
MRIPAKVKIFVWGTMQETLPCCVTLANRNVKISGVEDVKHMLFLCPRVRRV